ncbi:MAG: cadmium-translocating P-type ATPase [Thermoflavifilum sp.]|nr:cadmium-translocating P-type ATPase [Thermoflavifilum sp.]
METVSCKVEGMSCSSCVNNITHYLEKAGMEDVMVSLATGDVQFRAPHAVELDRIWKGIEQMGYRVVEEDRAAVRQKKILDDPLAVKWLVSLVFTIPLLLHMWVSWSWLHLAWVQALLCTPVMVMGLSHFGKGAWHGLRNGTANMDVLITLSAITGYVYSLVVWLWLGSHQPLYFEAPASIFSFVLLGSWLEQKAVKRTASAVEDLLRLQVARAYRIDPLSGEVEEVDNRKLQVGDQIWIREGDQVPADSEVLMGEAWVNESLVTGESRPVWRQVSDALIGGTILERGSVRARVKAVGQQSVLGKMIALVKQAQSRKPAVQRVADRISAVFVPVVVGVALLTAVLSLAVFHVSLFTALLRAMAVLVIACPCAMGLATPAAIMVGLGRASKKGILIKDPDVFEKSRRLNTLVFDKTGTLTQGEIVITDWKCWDISEQTFQSIVASLERHSSHPIAKAIETAWGKQSAFTFSKVQEHKGWGMEGIGEDQQIYRLGQARWFKDEVILPPNHDLYLVKNNVCIGWIDLHDRVREEAKQVLPLLKKQGYRLVLLSGDRRDNCEVVAKELGIDEIYAEQTPEGKQQVLRKLMDSGATVAMIGDGINDAPALAVADMSIAVAQASSIAMQAASIVLLGGDLHQLPWALSLARHTYQTIRENLLWALAYNVIAIPAAAIGALGPIIAAFSMGFSDLVLAFNSLRLYTKKILPS